ncbi:family A1 protease, partial [Sistotremastrum suecicum HHB10207 ss-3]
FAALTSLVLSSPVIETREPLVHLPLSRRLKTGGLKLIEHDQARARALIAGRKSKLGKRASENVTVENQAVSYVATVAVGSPATDFSLIVDTGSSNTWVGAGERFKETSTTQCSGQLVEVEYGSGFFIGEECTDTVSLGPDLVIKSQSIGAALLSEGFEGVDGIIGLGPVDLTEGTVQSFPGGSSVVPTVTNNLVSQGTIAIEVVGVSFEPTTSDSALNGVLTFGGVDSSKFIGDLTFVNVTTISPASEFWGIDQQVSIGSSTILSTTAGIVDTGTTLVLLATDAYDQYVSATGATLDQTTGLLTVPSDSSLVNLDFLIGGKNFSLTPNAQIWPRALNTDIGGTADAIYLIVGDLGTDSGEGLDFINGMTFLERFYSVFDTTNNRVGFASTPFTNATTN